MRQPVPGSATVAGSSRNIVGSIKDGVTINIHGTTAGGETFIIFGDYQAVAPPKINVSYLYPYSGLQKEYDEFHLSYGGAPIIKGGCAALLLLLLNNRRRSMAGPGRHASFTSRRMVP